MTRLSRHFRFSALILCTFVRSERPYAVFLFGSLMHPWSLSEKTYDQVQHGKAGGSRLPTVREEAEDHHDDASSLLASSADSISNSRQSIGGGGGTSRRSSSSGTGRRESNATVSLPAEWSALMSEKEFEGVASVSNDARRGSLGRESQCELLCCRVLENGVSKGPQSRSRDYRRM